HRETASLLAGTGRFDGSVEREQVGLLGDAIDHAQYHADAGAVVFDPLDDLRRVLDVANQHLDAIQRLGRHLDAGLGFFVRSAGGRGRLRRVTGDFLHGSAHFVHRRRNHVGFTALLDDRAVGLFRNAGDAIGHFTELARHAGHGLETVAELADHAVEGVAHRAHFVFGTDHHSAAQVLMGGHFLHGVTHGIDAADDHAADDVAHHQQSGEQQQQLDTGGNQDVAVYLAVQRGQVIGDAHRAHDRILRHLVAGKTVGAAVVLLGVDRVDHRQNATLFALGHLHDGFA